MAQPDHSAGFSSSSASSVLIVRTSTLGADDARVLASDSSSPRLEPCMQSFNDSQHSLLLLESRDGECLGEEADRAWKTIDGIAALKFTLDREQDGCRRSDEKNGDQDHDADNHDEDQDATASLHEGSHGCTAVPGAELFPIVVKTKKPFQRWINTLRRRGVQRRRAIEVEHDVVRQLQLAGVESAGSVRSSHHQRNSSSDSSYAFITGMKSPSVSLASFSILGRSRKTAAVLSSKAHSRTDQSSRASVSGVRASEESQCAGPNRGMPLDSAVAERSIQRRRILEELITTEEGYIGDIRFLMNVYVTILASLPTQTPNLRSSINSNMTEIIELHEELLGELHRAVPHSEYTQQAQLPPCGSRSSIHGHHRLRSLDSVPENNNGMSWLQNVPDMIVEPHVVAEVARIFTSKMNHFFVYEEYGAKYELMMKDIALARRSLPDWEKYQKGLEALAGSLGSESSSGGEQSRKSLTIGDLLVKPIQRVCKYPLLFAELLKYTPVVDCPHSHMVIEDVLLRLREATGEINRATDDPQIKATLERSWILQDRLAFPNQLDAASKNRIRSFGHVRLCGALHVCWQTKESVTGQYLICLLYRERLCIASASKTDQIYTILFCIAIANIKVEDADNGRGLQCHTAPFSWKLVFECDYQLYEIIMTACTPKEYHEWRSRLEQCTAKNMSNTTESVSFNALSLNIKSLGTVFGKPGTIARRISIHRATTVGPKSALCQVILKNTSVEKDAAPVQSAKGGYLNRSQSLLGPNGRIPMLTPSRGERARLEALLSDVWTREILPFPGMTVRARSEHLVRSSASSVIRKLSAATIASSFSKRSASLASMSKIATDDDGLASTLAATEAVAVTADATPPLWTADVVAEEKEPVASRSIRVTPEKVDGASDVDTATPTPVRVLPPDGDDMPAEPVALARIRSCSDSAIVTRSRTTEHAMDAAVNATATVRETQPVTGHLRVASPNSLRTGERPSSQASKTSPAVMMRHSSCAGSPNARLLQLPQDSCKASSIKSVGRWAKVGARHRGVMVQGIRSFFR